MNVFLRGVILALITSTIQYKAPKITMKRLTNAPVISNWQGQSDFLYNYNAAHIPLQENDFALAVRVQDLLPHHKTIYDVGPSKIVLVKNINGSMLDYEYVSSKNIIIDADIPEQEAGAEDPRVILHNGTYYMFYTAVSWTKDHQWHAKLSLATCSQKSDITMKENWKLHGQLFPDQFWSKSGSLLIHNTTHRYLFWNESNIELAITKDLIHYTYTGKSFISVRKDKFDSELIEPGPEPQKLSDGNYLFLYNSARVVSTPQPKPNWNRQYNIGYVILDGKDPMNILERSDKPIFSPELLWEKCDNNSGHWKDRGLTPLVVFVEGWRQIGNDRWLVMYQGCDATIGMAEVTAEF